MQFKRSLTLLFLAAFVGAAVPLTATAATLPLSVDLPTEGDEGPQGYIVAFREMPGVAEGDRYHGATVTQVIPQLAMIVVKTDDAPVFKVRANADDNVRYVTWDNPAYATLTFTPNDALYNDPNHYGSKIIGGEGAWDVTLGSTAVKVAMVDSGLNKAHEEFAGQSRVLQGYDFYNNDNDPEDSSRCSYHGTHTTGTAGATTNNGLGIAGMSQHTILPVKIFHRGFGGCGTTTSAIVNALKYTGDQGAHISSNSWGGGSSDSAINDAILYAHNLGVTHVAAAGNSGPCTNCVGQPWKDNPTITIVVTASTASDTFASFSSEGPEVDIIAPGDNILSTTDGTSGYAAYDGTSMATPHVAGTLALVKAVNTGYGFAELENAIKSTAVNLGISSDKQGSGRVNACAAVGSTTCDSGGSEPPASGTMHVHDIAHSRQGSPRTGDLLIDVTIADSNEAGLGSVSTCVSVTRNSDGASASGCGTTGSTGTVSFRWAGVGGGSYTTCVTSLTRTDYTWDSTADHASGGSCHTSSV